MNNICAFQNIFCEKNNMENGTDTFVMRLQFSNSVDKEVSVRKIEVIK